MNKKNEVLNAIGLMLIQHTENKENTKALIHKDGTLKIHNYNEVGAMFVLIVKRKKISIFGK
jgi:hypothetical protein